MRQSLYKNRDGSLHAHARECVVDEPDRDLVGILTRQAMRRGSFADLTRAWNGHATPFVWNKTADQILAKGIRKPKDSSGALH